MGILDDAIREHLELKRRHGAAEDELRRQEEEALGPARREVAPPEAHDGDTATEPVAAEAEAAPIAELGAPPEAVTPEPVAAPEAPAPELHEPAEPAAIASEPEAIEPEPEAIEPEPEAIEPEEDIHRKETVFLDFPPDEPAAEPSEAAAPAEPEPHAGRPAGEPPHHEEGDLAAPLEPKADHPSGETVFDPARHEPHPGGTPPRGFEAVEDDELLDEGEGEPEEEDEPEDADVLEDTPDFLQETPEHDRLWFEQKPPRDFDFD